MSNREGAQEASSHIDQRVSGAQIAPFPALSEPYLHGGKNIHKLINPKFEIIITTKPTTPRKCLTHKNASNRK